MSAIEELAGVDVLCSDKTGTLTQNKLTLGDPFTLKGVSADQIILSAALASRAEDKDTIDLAVLGGLKDAHALKGLPDGPLSAVRSRAQAHGSDREGTDGKQFRVAKGAPQVILADVGQRRRGEGGRREGVEEFAARGFRSLGVARADEKRQVAVTRRLATVRPAA